MNHIHLNIEQKILVSNEHNHLIHCDTIKFTLIYFDFKNWNYFRVLQYSQLCNIVQYLKVKQKYSNLIYIYSDLKYIEIGNNRKGWKKPWWKETRYLLMVQLKVHVPIAVSQVNCDITFLIFSLEDVDKGIKYHILNCGTRLICKTFSSWHNSSTLLQEYLPLESVQACLYGTPPVSCEVWQPILSHIEEN